MTDQPGYSPAPDLQALHNIMNELRASQQRGETRLQEIEQQMAMLNAAMDGLMTARAAEQEIENTTEVVMKPTGFPYLARHNPIFFASDQDVALYLFDGWWPQEEWGVWGKEDCHSIRFALDASYSGGYADIILKLQGPPAPQMEELLIHATANGYFLGHFTLRPHPRRIRLRMTPSCIGNGDIFLQLQHSGTARSSETPDMRPLGLGLISLEVR